MRPRRRRTAGQEFRGFILALIFAGVAYWFFASGLYIDVVTVVADWYTDQVMPLPRMPTPSPESS